jgi:hypothetical protein
MLNSLHPSAPNVRFASRISTPDASGTGSTAHSSRASNRRLQSRWRNFKLRRFGRSARRHTTNASTNAASCWNLGQTGSGLNLMPAVSFTLSIRPRHSPANIARLHDQFPGVTSIDPCSGDPQHIQIKVT